MPKKQTEPDFRPFLNAIDSLGLEAGVHADIMGGNTARLLGFEQLRAEKVEVKTEETPQAAASVVTKIGDPKTAKVEPYMSVRAVVEAWPETRPVLDRYGIPWQDFSVPFWEPLAQAAAAHGLGPSARNRLLERTKRSISKRSGDST